jgi:hypothetical protein
MAGNALRALVAAVFSRMEAARWTAPRMSPAIAAAVSSVPRLGTAGGPGTAAPPPVTPSVAAAALNDGDATSPPIAATATLAVAYPTGSRFRPAALSTAE